MTYGFSSSSTLGSSGTTTSDGPRPETATATRPPEWDQLEAASAIEVLSWGRRHFGDGLVVACSFQDAVLAHLVATVDRGIEVLFLDTGFHFPETLAFAEDVSRSLRIDLRIVSAGLDPEDDPCGTPACCQRRKVEPLEAALEGRLAWATGLRRVDSPTRAMTPVVEWDPLHAGRVKLNPLATWTDDDVAAYESALGLPRHPLFERGYRSIGCAPTTRPTAPGEDPRAGRWPGQAKTECGLHPATGRLSPG